MAFSQLAALEFGMRLDSWHEGRRAFSNVVCLAELADLLVLRRSHRFWALPWQRHLAIPVGLLRSIPSLPRRLDSLLYGACSRRSI